MSTKPKQIHIAELRIDVVRKDIKNLHLAVYPPNGRVRVASPLQVDDEAVRLFLISRLNWIRRQQSKFEKQARQPVREFVSGESHYFQGKRYLLNVIYRNEPPKVAIRSKKYIDLCIREGSDRDKREKIMLDWYRQELKQATPAIIEKWEKIMNLKVYDWGIKRMKTKWGTCNIEAKRIWLNLELIKKPTQCLEYVIVHEMAHFLERNHNDRFVAYLDQYLPNWRLIKEELNQFVIDYPYFTQG